MFKQKMSAEVINQSFTEYTVEKLNGAHLNYANGSPEYEQCQASILHDYQNALVSNGLRGDMIFEMVGHVGIEPTTNGL